MMWIFLHFFPIGWPQLNAVYEHGYAWARSQAFYDQYSVLAVDAHAGRHRLLGRRADDGLGFPDEAAAAARRSRSTASAGRAGSRRVTARNEQSAAARREAKGS